MLHFTTDNLHQQNSRTGEKLAKMSCTGNTFLAQSRELLISRLGNFPWYSSNATRPATRFQPPRPLPLPQFLEPNQRRNFVIPRCGGREYLLCYLLVYPIFVLSLGTENVGGCHSRKSFIHATVHRYTDGQLVKPSGDWEPFRSDPGSSSLWGNVEIDPGSVTH